MAKQAGKITLTVLTAAIAALPFIGIWQRQAIFDWYRLQNYTPPAKIVQIADNTTLTDEGRHLFYVYHAELQGAKEFNQNCRFSEQSIVLGCYVSNDGIYIFNVTDERLDGIHEVTAAHEVLHAAYDRLGEGERQRIDTLTKSVFDTLDNERIKEAVASYRDRDPSIVPNELHSILGTEVRDLPAELETHYAQYFSNRQKIVDYSAQYEQAFTERKQKAEQLLNQIEDLKSRIDSLNEQLTQDRAEIDAEYNYLQNNRSGADPESYNQRVNAYNTKVRTYNANVQRSYSMIDQYNALVQEYNQVVVEEQELIEAIDSRPDTIRQQ